MTAAFLSLRSRVLMSFSFYRRLTHRRKLVNLIEARIRAERRIGELFERLPVEARIKNDRNFVARMILLRQYSMLTNNELRHLAHQYNRASKVIHGSMCEPKRARNIVQALGEQVARLHDKHGYRSPQPRTPQPQSEVRIAGFGQAVSAT